MDAKISSRKQELDSMLRDPLLTKERREALLAERSGLFAQRESAGEPAASGLTVEGEGQEQWRAGLAKSSAKMMGLAATIVETRGFTLGSGKEPAPGSTNKLGFFHDVKEELKSAPRVVGSIGAHMLTASAVGFAVAGPVGAILGPLVDLVAEMHTSTLAMAALPYLASKALKGVELGSGLLEKLGKRRSEFSNVDSPHLPNGGDRHVS